MEKQRFTTWFLSGAITLPKLVVLIVTIGGAATVAINYLLTLDKGTLAIYFAAFQALVCLLLLILVPRPVPPHNPSLLKITEISAPHNLIRKLKIIDGPYKLILTQLRNSRHRVEKYIDGEPVDFRFLSELVEELNGLIKSNALIYDSEIFSKTQLSSETLKICKSKPRSSQCIRANRMILEDLFSEEISQYPRCEDTVKKACRNIRLWIQLMFLCWAIYYGVQAASAYSKDLNSTNPPGTTITNPNSAPDTAADSSQQAKSPSNNAPAEQSRTRIFNFVLSIFSTLTAVFIFFLYVEMSELTVKENSTSDDGQATDDDSREQVQDAFNQKSFFAFAAFLVMCLAASTFILPKYGGLIERVVDIIVACGSGVVMALVIGRLGSKFIDPGTGVIAILYLYAVIQPMAIFFAEKPNARFYATTLALFLKAFLWLVFYWTFTDGKLWSYVVAVRNLLLGEARNPHELLGAR